MVGRIRMEDVVRVNATERDGFTDLGVRPYPVYYDSANKRFNKMTNNTQSFAGLLMGVTNCDNELGRVVFGGMIEVQPNTGQTHRLAPDTNYYLGSDGNLTTTVTAIYIGKTIKDAFEGSTNIYFQIEYIATMQALEESIAEVDTNAVHKTGAEQVNGVKTFGNRPVMEQGVAMLDTNHKMYAEGGQGVYIEPYGTTKPFLVQQVTGKTIARSMFAVSTPTDGNYVNELNIGSRRQRAGVSHGSMGHQTLILWGDTIATNGEGSGSDGGWGLMFGPVGNPYLYMQSEETKLGRVGGTTNIRGTTTVSRNDGATSLFVENTGGGYGTAGALTINMGATANGDMTRWIARFQSGSTDRMTIANNGKITAGANAQQTDTVMKLIGYDVAETIPIQERGDGGVVRSRLGRGNNNTMYMSQANYGGRDFEFRNNYKFTDNLTIKRMYMADNLNVDLTESYGPNRRVGGDSGDFGFKIKNQSNTLKHNFRADGHQYTQGDGHFNGLNLNKDLTVLNRNTSFTRWGKHSTSASKIRRHERTDRDSSVVGWNVNYERAYPEDHTGALRAFFGFSVKKMYAGGWGDPNASDNNTSTWLGEQTWNARLGRNDMNYCPVYADNAAASAGGRPVGRMYRKSDGTLMVRY